MSCSPSTTTTTTSPAASSSTIGFASMWGGTIPARESALTTPLTVPSSGMNWSMADRLDRYREKRDPGATPEPDGAVVPGGDAGHAPRFVVQEHHARAAALGSAARARRRARLLGGAARHPARARAQPPGGAHGGPPARVPRVPRRDPGRPVRRGDDDDLGPRHLRDAQVPRRRGHGHVPRRARARPVRPVPDARRRLDDPPDGPAGRPGPGADARAARADARAHRPAPARRRPLGVRDQVGRRARDRLRAGRHG